MDYPGARFHLPVIGSTISQSAIGVSNACFNNSPGGSAVYPTANLAIFVPFRLFAPYLVKTLWWANGAAVAGTVDVGVYTPGGALLVSAANPAQAGTAGLQTVVLGTPIRLYPGTHYMALSCSSTTSAFWRFAPGVDFIQMEGCAQQVTANPLPAAATLATLGSAYIPLFGIANATVL